jgi:peptidoglycan/xylan/chitin deacetylase (PgdA/CDA1 family)
MKRLLWTAGVIAATGAVAWAGPAVTALAPVRRRFAAPQLSGVGAQGHVALTFDDGPDPLSTPLFLQALESAGVKATFFLIGQRLSRFSQVGKEIAAAGHELAVHGWDHRCVLAHNPFTLRDGLARTRDLIGELTGATPHWYRPPYGVMAGGVAGTARRLGLTPVLWSAWGLDWRAKATPGSVAATVMRDLAGGGTILLHDCDRYSVPGSWRNTLGALPAILRRCDQLGVKVGPLADHAQSPSLS